MVFNVSMHPAKTSRTCNTQRLNNYHQCTRDVSNLVLWIYNWTCDHDTLDVYNASIIWMTKMFRKAVWSIIRRMDPESIGDSSLCVCVCVKLDRFDSWPQYVQGMHSIASTLRWLFIVEVFAIYKVMVMHCCFSILRKVLQHAIEKKRVFYIIIIVKIHDKHCLRCIMCILCHIINWCDTGEMSPITNVILLYWRCLEWMFAILI